VYFSDIVGSLIDDYLMTITCYSRILDAYSVDKLSNWYLLESFRGYSVYVGSIRDQQTCKKQSTRGQFLLLDKPVYNFFMTRFTIFTVCIASTLRRHKVDPTGSEVSFLLPLLNPNLWYKIKINTNEQIWLNSWILKIYSYMRFKCLT